MRGTLWIRLNGRRSSGKRDILGYTSVSTADQNVAAQEDRLRQAGAIRVFVDVISGGQLERPGLSALIDHARAGDSLCVTHLDRLERSLKELIETVENLKRITFTCSASRNASTRPRPPASWCSMSSGRLLTSMSRDGSSPSVRATGLRPSENGAGGQGGRHWIGRPSRPRQPSSRLA